MSARIALAGAIVLAFAGAANADTIIYQTGTPTGYFTPFSSGTPAGTKYGDSGWVGSGGDAPLEGVKSITLHLAVSVSSFSAAAGSTDLNFTFNTGDPSGLVFGSGAQLYSTTVTGVTLPAVDSSEPAYFDVTIPLPYLTLDGGFNNVGWSVGVSNFSYAGFFGFQNRGAFNFTGFMTGNASQYSPNTNSWSLFSFGPGFPSNSANFGATIAVPEPGVIGAVTMLGVAALRRRRRA